MLKIPIAFYKFLPSRTLLRSWWVDDISRVNVFAIELWLISSLTFDCDKCPICDQVQNYFLKRSKFHLYSIENI